MSKHSYTEIEFKNAPDHKTTPLNASNMCHIEHGVSDAFTDISETQKIIAPVEDTLTASQAYAIGDQFIYQNVLYKATAAISAGGSISINGNCKATDSIAEQMTNNCVHYSQTEHVIGTWIDGSDLYEKTINIGALPNNANKSVAHGISNLKRVIDISGYSYRNSGEVTFPLPYVTVSVLTACVEVYVSGTNIVIATGTDRSAFTDSYITLRYTKTS